MDETKSSNPSPDKPTNKDYKKKRFEEIGSTLTQIKARVEANRSCARKDEHFKSSSRKALSEKSEKYIQVLELDKAKAQKLEKDRPKMKEALENFKIDRESQKLMEKKIEETRAKQSVPLPEIPSEVQKRISDLEITVHNLKEMLSEKERVLKSKTESWKLLSDQLEQRNIEVVERSEVMAKEIEEVKKSYAEQEVFLREQMDKYKTRLQEAESQLISQENSRKEEEEMKRELEELRSEHSNCQSNLAESKKAIDAEKKFCLKLKAQLKKFNNQINSNKDLGNEVERLRNQVATLEEEKEAGAKSRERIEELESIVEKLNEELSSFKEQCSRVNNDYNDLCGKLTEKEDLIKTLSESLERMEHIKISSEFKAAELEEKLEAENREDRTQNYKMTKEIDNLKRHVRQQEETVEELRSVVEQKKEEIRSLREGGEMLGYDTSDLKELLDEWKFKYSRVEENVSKVEEEKRLLEEKVVALEQQLDALAVQHRQEVAQCQEENKRLTQTLATEQQSKAEPSSTENKPDDRTQKLKKLAANLKIKVKLCKELEEKVEGLNEKLSQREKAIDTLTKEKSDLENLVTEYKMKLENISLDTDVVDQLKNLLTEKEALIKDLTERENERTKSNESAELRRVRTESYKEIKHLREENLELESELNKTHTEVHSVGERSKKSTQTDDDDLAVQFETKSKLILELQNQILDLNSRLENAIELDKLTKQELDRERCVIEEMKKEMEVLESQKNAIHLDLSDRNDLMNQIEVLKSEVESSRKAWREKENIISSFEQQLAILRNELNQNEHQLEKMQNLYINESAQNDGVLTNIKALETELNLNKNEITSLSEQLYQVSSNYELCMVRLQEKDELIDKLERESSHMREKIQQLELSVDQRQKLMEETARQLEKKQEEASSIGSNFQQYRSEMERKLFEMDQIGSQLNDNIAALAKINLELEAGKGEAEAKVDLLSVELNDIKNAYNTTLDQIELLNVELNQVMAQIEHRNKELVRIGEERNSLLGRLSELEQTCGELRFRLQHHEEHSETLKSELDSKLKELDNATTEITDLQGRLGESRVTENSDLNKELESLRVKYEERLRELQIEKDDLLKAIQGTVEPELESVMKEAEESVGQKGEIKLFSWGNHTESAEGNKDDMWGWNPLDAKLEEEFQNSETSKYKQLEQEKHKLKIDNEALEEELKALKIKCAKLMAKIKNLKSTSDQVRNRCGFQDLDFAMQEELRCQLDELGKKNEDLIKEVSTLKAERERLNKRVETLTAANNQLIEMKEQQDIQVQVLQKNCVDLKNQLHTFDWNDPDPDGIEGPSNEKTSQDKSISSLLEKLAFLETENDELLQIICSLRDDKKSNSNLKARFDQLKQENELRMGGNASDGNIDEINRLNHLLQEQSKEFENKTLTITQLTEQKFNLEKQVDLLKSEVQSYKDLLSSQNDTTAGLEAKNQEILLLNKNVSELKNEIKELSKSLSEKDGEILKLKVAEKRIDDLLKERSQLADEVDELKSKIQTLLVENNNLRDLHNDKAMEIDLLKADMAKDESFKNSALNELESLRRELSRVNEEKNFMTFSDAPVQSSSAFDSMSSPPVFTMFDQPSSSEPVSVPVHEQPKDDVVGSPPVFRGFFPSEGDSFAVALGNNYPQSSVSDLGTLPNSKTGEADNRIQQLNCRISELEQENLNLCQKIKHLSSETDLYKDYEDLKKALDNKENTIVSLQEEITSLNEGIKKATECYKNDKVNLLNLNRDLTRNVQEFKRTIDFLQDDLARLKSELDLLRNYNNDKTEQSKNNDLDELNTRYEEDLRLRESRYQNELLNREQENAHLTCEVMAKQVECDKITAKLQAVQCELSEVENQLETLKGTDQSHLLEIRSLKDDLSRLHLENQELVNLKKKMQGLDLENETLRKAMENDNQMHSAKIEYLKQSVEEKDSTIKSLNDKCDQLTSLISSLQNELKASYEKLTHLENCYSTLNSAHTEILTKNRSAEERQHSTDVEMHRLSETVAAFNRQLDEERSRYEQERLSSEATRSQDAEQVRYLVNQVEILQSAITEKDLEIERLSALANVLQEKLIKSEGSKASDEMLKLNFTLDKALETLHLRDIRCDELTLEITKLLDERDSLQLRLSNALKQIELLRECRDQHDAPSIGPSSLTESKFQLNTKLGELQSGYMRDPAVREDRESRHSQQMQLFTSNDAVSPVGGETIKKEVEATSSDGYGIFGWFFNSSTPPLPSQEPAT